jgi:GT2 family glycosyltransferase
LKIFEQAAKLVDYVVICDNSSDSSTILYLSAFCKEHPKFLFLKNDTNLGISKAYNKAVALAQNLGVFWLYFFDDDAQFDPRWISVAKESWQELKERRTPVGILAPIVTNDSAYLDSRIGLRGNYSIITSVITSGIFTNVDVFNHSGGYNPDFFVDWADLEFTRRVKQSGFLVIRLNIVLVFQAFGRSLDNQNLRNKLINAYIKSSSLLSLRLNKSNTFSTSYSIYSLSRYSNQKTNALWSMKHSGIKNLGFRLFLILVHHIVLPSILRKEISTFYKG